MHNTATWELALELDSIELKMYQHLQRKRPGRQAERRFVNHRNRRRNLRRELKYRGHPVTHDWGIAAHLHDNHGL